MRTRSSHQAPRRRTLLLNLPVAILAILAIAIPSAASAAAPPQFFGVSAVLPTETDFVRMGEAGLGTYRFDVSWRGVQTTRNGGYEWGSVDYQVRQAALAGMQPAPFLYGTPRFISKNDAAFVPPTGSKQNRRGWQSFLAAAVRRYGPDGEFWQQNPDVPARAVKSWIIWNEQNAKAFWRPKPDPRDYATLIEISDAAISSVDPDASIVLGGMYGYPNKPNIRAVEFLERFYAVPKIEQHFEAIGVHPYGAGVATVKTQIKQARAAVKKAGDPNVGIVVGEIGWASTGPKSSDPVVGAKGQATRLQKGLALLARKRRAWNLLGAYIYVWRDFEIPSACLWCPGAGLVQFDGTPKPALKSVEQAIRSNR